MTKRVDIQAVLCALPALITAKCCGLSAVAAYLKKTKDNLLSHLPAAALVDGFLNYLTDT